MYILHYVENKDGYLYCHTSWINKQATFHLQKRIDLEPFFFSTKNSVMSSNSRRKSKIE